MKTILRNLLSVVRRFKAATTLNILGLSIAFASFMVIMMQLDFDYNFDRMYPDSGRIYRMEQMNYEKAEVVVSRPIADLFIRSSPHVEAGALVNPWFHNLYFTVERNGEKINFQESLQKVYPAYTGIFPFDMAEGSADALEEPGKALIPLSLARKLFGEEPALNRSIEQGNATFTVGGVYRDFPRNTVVRNTIYIPFSPQEGLHEWGNSNYQFYVRLNSPENVQAVIDNFKAQLAALDLGDQDAWVKDYSLRLTALPDIHYTTDVGYDNVPKTSLQVWWVLLSIAVVIILIAGINFTNFSMALTPMRIKSINTQKVLGGEQGTIRRALLAEAVAISLCSFLLALVLVHLMQGTRLEQLVDADIVLTAHPLIVGGTAVMALLTGLLAGVYPSYYMTSFQPALVLKGSFGLSASGRQLRNVLIGVQFIASFALIIGAGFMYLQNRYMYRTPLGYDKDALIVTDLNGTVNKSLDAFTDRVKSFAGVDGITFGQQLISSQDQYMGWSRKHKGEDVRFQCMPVDPSYIEVMGIHITEGRAFRKEDELKKYGALIFNERARAEYGLELGLLDDSMDVVGFMSDVHFGSFRSEVTPMAFYVWGIEKLWDTSPLFAYIKVAGGTDMRAAMDHVKASLKEIDPDYPFRVSFYDEVLNLLYEKENNLSVLITLFSLIAIFISIVGVFGLVMFESEYRRKEIGLRKVMGSTTREILVLFNKGYVRILCLCFVLAAPVAWYAVHRWLENFAYKTPMYWWVFPAAFAVVACITIATVTFQNWWAANENPVNTIKSE